MISRNRTPNPEITFLSGVNSRTEPKDHIFTWTNRRTANPPSKPYTWSAQLYRLRTHFLNLYQEFTTFLNPIVKTYTLSLQQTPKPLPNHKTPDPLFKPIPGVHSYRTHCLPYSWSSHLQSVLQTHC